MTQRLYDFTHIVVPAPQYSGAHVSVLCRYKDLTICFTSRRCYIKNLNSTCYTFTMMRFTTLALFISSVSAGAVPSLTPENYDKLTEGKTVFLKFFAPWVSD
jgi:hypothetical protein